VIEATSLWRLVEARAAASPDALLVVDAEDRALSFGEYRHAAERCAAGLAALGVGEASPVSWMLPSEIEALVLAGALARLGAVQNPILPIYRERETDFITRQTGAQLLAVPGIHRSFDYASMAHAVAAQQPNLEVLVVERELPDGNPAALPPLYDGGHPVRWVFYTSGTTADPKGALHTDASLIAASRGMAQRLDLQTDDRVALVFPVTHVGGVGWLIAALLAGCALIAVPVFDPRTSIGVLARHGVTQGTAGTAFHRAYLEAQRAHGPEPLFPQIRSFPGGGAPNPPQLHEELKRELGGAGIVSGYGLTECPIVTMNAVDDPDEKLAHTEGRANATDIRIVNGEIRVKGPQLCRGYLDPALNAAAFDADGYFCTGDLGALDADDYLTITGRLKDVIIRKGENISAREVEDLLYQHPKVADVAVIGLPDPNSGERCCAVVACRDAAEPLQFDEMSSFLREQNLAVQKIPEQLELVAELPRNPTGKIQKDELRRRYSS
jgi:acyl-CoA synthetase (AMP-forming)/AMP-acid ligase II